MPETLDRIERLAARAAELRAQLRRSLALQALLTGQVTWPVHTWWEGSPARGFRFHVRDHAGEVWTFAPSELPDVLREGEPDAGHLARRRDGPQLCQSSEAESGRARARALEARVRFNSRKQQRGDKS